MTNKQSPVVSPLVHFCRAYKTASRGESVDYLTLRKNNYSRSPSDRFQTASSQRGDQLAMNLKRDNGNFE